MSDAKNSADKLELHVGSMTVEQRAEFLKRLSQIRLPTIELPVDTHRPPTLRQYYAANAMRSLVTFALSKRGSEMKPEDVAADAFEYADAMIAFERGRQSEGEVMYVPCKTHPNAVPFGRDGSCSECMSDGSPMGGPGEEGRAP